MRPQLLLVPQGGLCNRLRTLLSALAVSRQMGGGSIRVEWADRQPECSAGFHELFQPLDTDHLHITPRHWWNIPDERKNLHLPGLLRHCLYSRQVANFHPDRQGDIHHYLRTGQTLYISTCFPLCDYPPELSRQLRLLPSLQQQVDRRTAHFADNTIGIHIRRTDNSVSIKKSPEQAFAKAIELEIEANTNVRFYLASDDEALKRRFLRRYGFHIQTDFGTSSRSTLEGMQEAAIQLWSLARTRRLLGSYWSSFSDMAAEIGGIPLHIVQQ